MFIFYNLKKKVMTTISIIIMSLCSMNLTATLQDETLALLYDVENALLEELTNQPDNIPLKTVVSKLNSTRIRLETRQVTFESIIESRPAANLVRASLVEILTPPVTGCLVEFNSRSHDPQLTMDCLKQLNSVILSAGNTLNHPKHAEPIIFVGILLSNYVRGLDFTYDALEKRYTNPCQIHALIHPVIAAYAQGIERVLPCHQEATLHYLLVANMIFRACAGYVAQVLLPHSFPVPCIMSVDKA